MAKTKGKVDQKQLEQLDDRIAEIQKMTDKQLVWVLATESGWEYCARKEMKIELANNLYKDMEELKTEILIRMRVEPTRKLL